MLFSFEVGQALISLAIFIYFLSLETGTLSRQHSALTCVFSPQTTPLTHANSRSLLAPQIAQSYDNKRALVGDSDWHLARSRVSASFRNAAPPYPLVQSRSRPGIWKPWALRIQPGLESSEASFSCSGVTRDLELSSEHISCYTPATLLSKYNKKKQHHPYPPFLPALA